MTIQTERVDDVPLLLGQQWRMGIRAVVDDIIKPHGNRQGLSIGMTVETWVSYILSEADHRMCVVEEWVADKREMLEQTLGEPVNAKDFTDDRLASVLRDLSDDATWQAIEQALGQRLMRVYDLKRPPVRLDSTTVTVYHEVEEGGLFQYGHSKDHRPDLPQFKLMLGSLDPMGMPVATLAVEGNAADDGLYIPTIQQARPILGTGGQLYVGDSKMSALGTRAFIQAGQDSYLTSLPHTGKTPDLLEEVLKPVWEKRQALECLPFFPHRLQNLFQQIGRFPRVGQAGQITILPGLNEGPCPQRAHLAVADIQLPARTEDGACLLDGGDVQPIIGGVPLNGQGGDRHSHRVQTAQHQLELRQVRSVVFAVTILEQSAFFHFVIDRHGGAVQSYRRTLQIVNPHQPLAQRLLNGLPGRVVAQVAQYTRQPVIGEIFRVHRFAQRLFKHLAFVCHPLFDHAHAVIGLRQNVTHPCFDCHPDAQSLPVTVRFDDIVHHRSDTHPPLLSEQQRHVIYSFGLYRHLVHTDTDDSFFSFCPSPFA